MLNELGKELLTLSDGQLKKIPLSNTMREALADARRFSRGALQRQLRRIASLMQAEDVDAIQQELARQKQPDKQQTAELHQLEQWRDRLVGGDERLLTELIEQFPNIDRQRIRQLARNAQLEIKRSKPPKSSRALFRYLAELKRVTAPESESQGLEN